MACIKLLVAAGASLESQTKRGETPLLVAAHAEADRAALALVAAGANAAAMDADGATVASLRPRLSSTLATAAAGGETSGDWDA